MTNVTAGEISRKPRTVASFEWKIRDFSRLPKEANLCVRSPIFSFLDADWRLKIYPNGEENSNEWIGLYVSKVYSNTESHYVAFRVSIMERDGTEYDSISDEDIFKGNESGWGYARFLLRSSLLKMKNKITPQDTMTIFCILHSPVCGSKEVASQATHREGGYKRIVGKGKESENTDDVTEDATLSKPTGGDKRSEGEGKESTNTDDLTEDVTLSKPTSIDKLARDFKNLLTSEKDSDVTLKVKNKEFRTHSVILRTRSSVFNSMFDHDMSEKNSGIVDIPDCDPEAFQYFLTYLYSASMENLSNEIVFNLYFIADKYDVEELKHKCVDFMSNNLSVDTFCNVVALALKHEESALLVTATDFFMKHTIEVLESVQWQSFHEENPVTANELYIKSFYFNTTQK